MAKTHKGTDRAKAAVTTLVETLGSTDGRIRVICAVDKDVHILIAWEGVRLWKTQRLSSDDGWHFEFEKGSRHYIQVLGWTVDDDQNVIIKIRVRGLEGWINPVWVETPTATEDRRQRRRRTKPEGSEE